MPVDIKGYVLKDMVERVNQEKGSGGVNKLQMFYGGSIDFTPAKIYSEEECIRLLLAAAKALYGNNDPQSLFEVGRILAQNHFKSQLGKTGVILSKKSGAFEYMLFSSYSRKLVEKLLTFVSPSLQTEVESLNPETIIFTFYKTKMPPEFFWGEWSEFLKLVTHSKITTSYKRLSSDCFQIIFTRATVKENTVG